MALAQRLLYQVARPAGTSGGLLQHAAALTSLLRHDAIRFTSTAAQAQSQTEQAPASSTGQADGAARATSQFSAGPSGTGFAASGAQQQQQAASGLGSEGSSSTTSSTDAGSGAAQDSSEGTSSSGSSNSSSNSSSDSSSSSSAAKNLFSSFQDGFSSFRARMDGSNSSSSQQQQGPPEPLLMRAHRLAAAVAREVKDAVLPRNDAISLTRAYEGPRYTPGTDTYEGTTAVATVQQPQSRYSKLMEDLYSKFGHHPLFKRLWSVDVRANPVVRKAGEVAEDIRDRYETLDHPVVHKVEDVKERLFGMSDAASAMAQILARDPSFDMARLLASIKSDAPIIVKAFLTHDLATLKQHCGPELMEKFAGIFKHFEGEGLHEDPTILFVSEVELVEMRLVEDEPLVVAQFNCQQIKCTRDSFGNVMDGSPNSIQKVFYFWGLQQEKMGTVLPDGRVLPPRWVIKDMMWQSRLALV